MYSIQAWMFRFPVPGSPLPSFPTCSRTFFFPHLLLSWLWTCEVFSGTELFSSSCYWRISPFLPCSLYALLVLGIFSASPLTALPPCLSPVQEAQRLPRLHLPSTAGSGPWWCLPGSHAPPVCPLYGSGLLTRLRASNYLFLKLLSRAFKNTEMIISSQDFF